MEEAIKQSEEKFRTFADATYNWEYWIGPNGSLIYNSPSCERITEYLSHEFMNNPGLLELIVHPADRGLLLNHFSIIDSGDTCEIDFRIVTFTGQTRWIRHICLAVYSKDGQWLGRRASNMDITDRKLAEGQIKLNEARLSSLHEISQYKPDTIQELLDFTLEHAIKLTGSKIGYIYYYDEETQCFILNTWSKDVMKECKILEPQTVYELEKTGIWGEAVRQKKAIVVNYFMAPNPLKKGYPSEHVELLKFVTAPIFQGDKIVAVVGVANKESDYDETDVRQLSLLMDSVWRIVENQRAEEARKLLSTAIEQAAEGIIITDSIGIIQYVNPAEEAITGYNRDELIGRTPSIFKSDEHDEAFYWKIWETINAGNVWSGRFINKKKDGTEYHEDASISPVYDKSGNLTNFVAAKHDVTKEIELQQQLLQAQKMEAIGTLTGGFAHDFNNLLQVIMGHLDVILSVPDLPEKIQSSLNNIDRAATSGAELIKGMLLYSKKMPFKLRPVDLSEIVASFVTLIRRTIPREIKIEIVVADDLPVIKGDSTQIEQVLINLAINARDAMPDGGGLTIETRTTVLDEEFCRSYPDLKPGRYVLLSVMDTGKGMDQETVKHIYDPFFTTKEPGKGTGLGLSVVHGIVEKHGGKIICYSDPSVGTTFRIYFPAIEVPV